MSKEPNKALEGLLESAVESLFRPTPEQQQWKAKYWTTALNADNSPDVADVVRVIGTQKIRNVWADPAFKDWFLNKDSYRWKLEYLFDKATYAMEEILDNNDPKAQSARVNVIKLISELASKMPKPAEKENDLAKQIGSMDSAQLELFLEKKGMQLHVSASKGQAQQIVATDAEVLIDVEKN